jgi:membrane protease YdiL (CAAX protease family)
MEVAPRRARNDSRRSILLVAEYTALFIGLPLAFRQGLVPIPVIPALWILASACLLILLTSRNFDVKRLWNARHLRAGIIFVVLPFAAAAPLLLLFGWLYDPERLFTFVRERPLFWVLLMVIYPILSVYPQGIIYRAFILHRYRGLFGPRWVRILASAVAFSAAHIIYQNWLAPVLTFVGGLLFAWTYERTRSGLLAAVQHALFGCYLFTTGLGWYFYYGAVQAVS